MVLRALIAALAASALTPATASAYWFPVSEYPFDTYPGAQVGVDDAGRAAFAWVVRRDGEPFSVRHSRKIGPRSFLAPSTAAGSGNLPVDVAVAGGGATTISWVHRTGGQARLTGRRTATNTISVGDPFLISPTGVLVTDWRVAFLDDVTAVLVWTGADGSIGMRRWSTTAPASVTMLAQADSPLDLDLEADGRGGFLVGWTALDGSDRRAYVTDGVRIPRPVASPDRAITDLDLDIDDAGRAVIAWEQTSASGRRLLLRTRAADGALGSIAALDGNQPEPLDLRLAIGAAGAGVLAWRGAAGARALRTVAVSTTGAPGPRLAVTNPGVDAHAVGTDDAGEAVFVWETGDQIWTRRRPAGGALGPRRVISGAAVPAFAPELSVNATGEAIAVWSWLPGARTRAAGAVVP